MFALCAMVTAMFGISASGRWFASKLKVLRFLCVDVNVNETDVQLDSHMTHKHTQNVEKHIHTHRKCTHTLE